MSRLLELKPDDEADVVNRVVMQIHRAIDDLAMGTSGDSKRFQKTVFHQGEDTAVDRQQYTPEAPELVQEQPSSAQASPASPNIVVTASPQAENAPISLNMTDHAQLEYSSMSSLNSDQPNIGIFKKLCWVASVVIVLSVMTAFMAYQLLDP